VVIKGHTRYSKNFINLLRRRKINMKYIIEYEETIRRINSVTIDVEDEKQGEKIADELSNKAKHYNHPDYILEDLWNMGIKVIEFCEGAEDCKYEIQ